MKTILNPTAAKLINYTFSDSLANVGYITLYGIKNDAGAYVLHGLQLPSSAIYTEVAGGGTTEVNFDYTFLKDQLVKGNLFVSETYKNANTGTTHTHVRVLHYDGTTETEIGALQSSIAVGGVSIGVMTTLTFDINKAFKKGEKLRIEVLYIAGVSNNSRFYHDGLNRGTAGVPDVDATPCNTTFVVQVPIPIFD